MKIEQLIKNLSTYPPDMEIVVKSGENQYFIQHIEFSRTGAEVEINIEDDFVDESYIDFDEDLEEEWTNR